MAEINKKIDKIELISRYKRNLILMRGECPVCHTKYFPTLKYSRKHYHAGVKCFPTLKQFCKYTGLGCRIYAFFLQENIDPQLIYRQHDSTDFYNELTDEFSEMRKKHITRIKCWVEARREHIYNK